MKLTSVRIVGALAFGALAMTLAASAAPEPESAELAARPAENQYIGAKKCKSCHSSEEVGNQFGAWEAAKHSKAFATLASDRAKAIAKERGIEDAQKSADCMRCHATAWGVDDKLIKRGFKHEAGVQCETCHGPGGDHMKARFAAAMEEGAENVPEPGEIIRQPKRADCLGCHNDESPTFESFCFHRSMTKIRHLRPGAEVEPISCDCNDDCQCKSEECAEG